MKEKLRVWFYLHANCTSEGQQPEKEQLKTKSHWRGHCEPQGQTFWEPWKHISRQIEADQSRKLKIQVSRWLLQMDGWIVGVSTLKLVSCGVNPWLGHSKDIPQMGPIIYLLGTQCRRLDLGVGSPNNSGDDRWMIDRWMEGQPLNW